MASNGSFNTSAYDGRYLKFSWSAQSQSVVSNTTRISWRLEGAGIGNLDYYSAGNFKIIIDGTTVYSTGQNDRINLYNGTLVASGTYTLTHNANGSKNFTVSVQAGIYTYSVNCTGSDTFELPNITRVSTINTITGSKITDNFKVTYTEYSSTFTNNLLISINGQNTTQTITDYQSGVNFTLSTTLKNEIYNATESANTVVLSFMIETYSGSTLIGTSQATTVTISINNSNPVIGNVSYIDSNSTTVAITGNNQYIIRNKSILSVTLTNLLAINGANLIKVDLTIGSNTTTVTLSGTTANPVVNIGAVNLSSNSTLTVKLTDSRGNTSTSNLTVLIYDWVAPTAVIECARLNNYYTDTNLLVNSNYSSLGGHNSITIKAYTKLSSASSYGSAINITDGTATTLSLANTDAWNVKVVVSDKLESNTYILYVNRGLPIVFFDKLKNSMGVNCFPKNDESLEVNGIDILKSIYYFTGDQYKVNNRIVNGHITTNSTAIYFTLTLPKNMKNVTPAITELKVNARNVGGNYVFPYNSQGYNVLSDNSLSVTISHKEDDFITVTITSNTALNATNNTPLSITLEAITLSFS